MQRLSRAPAASAQAARAPQTSNNLRALIEYGPGIAQRAWKRFRVRLRAVSMTATALGRMAVGTLRPLPARRAAPTRLLASAPSLSLMLSAQGGKPYMRARAHRKRSAHAGGPAIHCRRCSSLGRASQGAFREVPPAPTGGSESSVGAGVCSAEGPGARPAVRGPGGRGPEGSPTAPGPMRHQMQVGAQIGSAGAEGEQ